jgi:alpha-ketoglutarate-dependent taurine dioxygenase
MTVGRASVVRGAPAINSPRGYSGALQTHGWALLRSFRRDLSGDEAAAALGRLWPRGGTHRIEPRRRDGAPNTYSGRYGCGPFPFHTDLAHHANPPRFLMLRCVRGYGDVRTPLIDGQDLVKAVGAELLARALVQPRRPSGGRQRLFRLFERGEADRLRWDAEYLRPSGVAGTEAAARLQAEMALARPTPIALIEPGDTLLIDNWRMLHARSSVPEACRDRILERAYLAEVL